MKRLIAVLGLMSSLAAGTAWSQPYAPNLASNSARCRRHLTMRLSRYVITLLQRMPPLNISRSNYRRRTPYDWQNALASSWFSINLPICRQLSSKAAHNSSRQASAFMP